MTDKSMPARVIVLLSILAVVVLGTPIEATEEGQTEDPKRIVLECRAGAVTEKMDWRGAEVTYPNCFCSRGPEWLLQWVESLADKWRAGEPLPQPESESMLVPPVPPGEERSITLHCLSLEQIVAYREAILAEREDTSGGE